MLSIKLKARFTSHRSLELPDLGSRFGVSRRFEDQETHKLLSHVAKSKMSTIAMALTKFLNLHAD